MALVSRQCLQKFPLQLECPSVRISKSFDNILSACEDVGGGGGALNTVLIVVDRECLVWRVESNRAI